MRVDLGNNQWADVIDVEDVPRRTKRRVQEWGLNEFHKDEQHPGVVEMVMRDMLIAYVVTSWSYDESKPPNGDPERIGDLPSGAYDKLLEATEEHWLDLDFLRTSGSSSGSRTISAESSPTAASLPADTSAH